MIVINLDKAKSIAHDRRRVARSAEFAPLDVKATIPSEDASAEVARQVIREKYATMQTQINSVQTIVELKSLLPKE
jgi:hypothetical protein